MNKDITEHWVMFPSVQAYVLEQYVSELSPTGLDDACTSKYGVQQNCELMLNWILHIKSMSSLPFETDATAEHALHIGC